MSDFDFDSLDMEEVKEIIAAAHIELARLRKQLSDAKESLRLQAEWTEKRKRQAGFSSNTSFDVVWDTVLKSHQAPRCLEDELK